MILIVRAVQTSTACPSQWDLWDDKDRYYYARFRHGCGELRQYKTPNWVDAPTVENVDKTKPGWRMRSNSDYIRTIADFESGGSWDGFIELEDFIAHIDGVKLSENLLRTGYSEHLRDQLVMESGFTFLLDQKNDDGTTEV
jgi:hypothetical protein